MPPRIFVASSTENLRVVHTICERLREIDQIEATPVPWDGGTFEPSQTIIGSLEKALDESNYAVLVLTPDDFVRSRGKKYKVPRDNALFELGLFMGRRGRDHCYIVHVSDDGDEPKFKLPTDLGGVLTLTYSERTKTKFRRSLDIACATILQTVEKREREKLATFCGQIAGEWWELITTKAGDELSFFKIVPDDAYKTVSLDGEHYGRIKQKIKRIGNWYSTAVGVHEDDAKIVYCWSGSHPPTVEGDAARVEGYGTMRFSKIQGLFNGGRGEFIDVDPNRMATAQCKKIELSRVVKRKDVRTMTEHGISDREALAGQILDSYSG